MWQHHVDKAFCDGQDGGIVTKLIGERWRAAGGTRGRSRQLLCVAGRMGDGKVYFASEPGVVSVVANDRDWKMISSHAFHEKIYPLQ